MIKKYSVCVILAEFAPDMFTASFLPTPFLLFLTHPVTTELPARGEKRVSTSTSHVLRASKRLQNHETVPDDKIYGHHCFI